MSQVLSRLKLTLILAFILISTGLMMACGATSMPESPPPADDVEIARVPPPTPTKPASPMPPAAVIAPDDGCVACHTSQEQLIAAAKPEVVAEILSEGEG